MRCLGTARQRENNEADEPTPSRTPLGVVAVLASSLGAQQIFNPDAANLAATTKSDIPARSADRLPGGTLTLTFLELGDLRVAPWRAWASASAAPFPERQPGETLAALSFGTAANASMTLSCDNSIFGSETDPDSSALFEFTATFFGGATQLGSFTRLIDGDAGARLVAFDGRNVDRVEFGEINVTSFAAAAFRGAGGTSVVPERSTHAQLGVG